MITLIIDILFLCILTAVYVLLLKYFKIDRKQTITVAICLLSYYSLVVTAPLIGVLIATLF